MKILIHLSFILLPKLFFCQNSNENSKIKISPISGAIVAGYIDHGAYINFTGPNLSYNKSGHSILIGMLPSLRFKKDSGATINSLVTPGLGIGVTYFYKAIAIQVPLYYNSKTSLKNSILSKSIKSSM